MAWSFEDEYVKDINSLIDFLLLRNIDQTIKNKLKDIPRIFESNITDQPQTNDITKLFTFLKINTPNVNHLIYIYKMINSRQLNPSLSELIPRQDAVARQDYVPPIDAQVTRHAEDNGAEDNGAEDIGQTSEQPTPSSEQPTPSTPSTPSTEQPTPSSPSTEQPTEQPTPSTEEADEVEEAEQGDESEEAEQGDESEEAEEAEEAEELEEAEEVEEADEADEAEEVEQGDEVKETDKVEDLQLDNIQNIKSVKKTIEILPITLNLSEPASELIESIPLESIKSVKSSNELLPLNLEIDKAP